uniref:Reverse transcriptase domain-containing protein n=1 Tax=Ditylenchus dipsaci TaxID=166011 RepID=A0A915E140_9BILA
MITEKQTYLLPLVADLHDTVAGKNFYSSFDLFAGFHQIPIAPEDRHKTAFHHAQWTVPVQRTPMGACSAPSTMTRAMDEVKRTLSFQILIYLDDLIIGSYTEEEHL